MKIITGKPVTREGERERREELIAIVSGLSSVNEPVQGLGHNIRGYQSERVGVQTRRT